MTKQVGEYFLARMQQYGASNGDVYASARKSMGLPTVPASEITAVTDEATCVRISRAIESDHRGDVPVASPAFVVRIGTHYMAMPPSRDGLIFHLDSAFIVRDVIVQQ